MKCYKIMAGLCYVMDESLRLTYDKDLAEFFTLREAKEIQRRIKGSVIILER